MKYLVNVSLMGLLLLAALHTSAQTDKSKRPSPPANVTQKVAEVTININYSQPSINGRTIGNDLEPKAGKVWRTGANEATVFEIDKDVLIEGQLLPKGKYGLFSLVNGDDWTIIFNKTWKQWGAFSYLEADDALRVIVKARKANPFSEKMTFAIDASGKVSLMWGDHQVDFTVK